MDQKVTHVIQRQDEVFEKPWGDFFGRAAERFLKENFSGPRCYVRIGRFSTVSGADAEFGAARIYADREEDPRNNCGFSADRLVAMARTIEQLWALDNQYKKFPYHDELMADIEAEVLSWAKPDAIKRRAQLERDIKLIQKSVSK